MERYLVLAKFHDVVEVMRSDEYLADKETPPSDFVLNIKKMRLSHYARKMLVTLFSEGSLNQRRLAKIMNISPQAVSENIKKLESSGYINKTNGLQKNENFIFLTDLGKQTAVELNSLIKCHANKIFANLTDNDVQKLHEIFEKIIEGQA